MNDSNLEFDPESNPIAPERELPPEPASEAALEALAEQVRQAQAERDALQDKLLRALADADNARKRAAREMQEARLRAATDALRPFLPVLDAAERAQAHAAGEGGKPSADELKALRTGIDLLHRQLADAARKAGLEPVTALDRPFDPHQHEAIEMVETDAVADGTVVEELQRGYRLQDRLIRPAMVKVARGK